MEVKILAYKRSAIRQTGVMQRYPAKNELKPGEIKMLSIMIVSSYAMQTGESNDQ